MGQQTTFPRYQPGRCGSLIYHRKGVFHEDKCPTQWLVFIMRLRPLQFRSNKSKSKIFWFYFFSFHREELWIVLWVLSLLEENKNRQTFVCLRIIFKFYGSLKPSGPRPTGTAHQSTVSQSRGTVTQTPKGTVYKSSEFSGLNKWISKEIRKIVTSNLVAPSFILKSHFKLGEGQEW